MANQQLLDYIRGQKQQGVDQQSLRGSLLASGWDTAQVDEAFRLLDSPVQQPVQPVPPESSAPAQTFSAQPSRKLIRILLISIFVIAVLVIGAGAFGYLPGFQSLAPEEVIQKMFSRLSDIRSLEYSGEVEALFDTGGVPIGGAGFSSLTRSFSGGVGIFSISFDGAFDYRDSEDPLYSLSLRVEDDSLLEKSVVADVEARVLDGIVYIKLNRVPELDIFDISFLQGQWVKIDPEVLRKQFGLNAEEYFANIQEQQGVSLRQAEDIREAVSRVQILDVTDVLPDEKIGGVDTHHYAFTVRKEGLRELVIDLYYNTQGHSLDERELAEFDRNLELAEFPNGEIWIGKKDSFPYKLVLSSVAEDSYGYGFTGSFSTVLLFKSFNQPVRVDVPASAIPLEEIFGALLGGVQGSSSGTFFPE
ncbi:hypothetical protein CL629_01555 [bacterium]|nr:hypothetical protein [bacterium]|tara:strand:+ start:83 stop:1336 length:1254 start_codon:yes stop_codon:yes gene_type:complete